MKKIPIFIGLAGVLSCSAIEAEVNFNRDIRPILSESCFHCHGPAEKGRKAKLRLDIAESAYRDRDGARAIVPSRPEESDVLSRVVSTDPDELMPPPDAQEHALTEQQVALLRQWIKEGAEYQGHWAFVVPTSTGRGTLSSLIDKRVRSRLKKDRLRGSRRADRETLIRRLSLDLRGVPPTIDEVEAFLSDRSKTAWESLVDRFLSSPACAERLALDWLDVARYSDTNGYSIDDHREMWGWRDWVIQAFLENKSYDEFIVEQLAGDLLPDATLQQKMATGFLRNGMNTHEGGTIAAEYRVAYIADKIDTVASTFMGLTMKCAQCHDHKYDPISQKDYYRFFAFFNSATESGKGAKNGNTAPVISVASPLGERSGMAQVLSNRLERIAYLQKHLSELGPASDSGSKAPSGLEQRFAKALQVEASVLNKQLKTVGQTSVMVMDDSGKHSAPMLMRGQYDQLGEVVNAGVPEIFPQLAEGVTPNRLALANWLIDDAHPLTARVAVNRFWQMIFGSGLVRTAEDFGSQGEWPSHPELLDELAVAFRESGWDVRNLLKEFVLSETYQQKSDVTGRMQESDPANRLLARAPRVRLQAELIRDNAFFISGLLSPIVGGPSTYPEQPDGLWRQISHFGYGVFTAQAYFPDTGEPTVRRSMYTFWKRTASPPAMAIFDAPTRETCTVRRLNTNTPLQALVLLNDPQFLKASRALARRMIDEGGSDAKNRIRYAFRLATARFPTSQEAKVLTAALARETARFGLDVDAAKKLMVGVGAAEDVTELASFTMVASTILNLNETITKQ